MLQVPDDFFKIFAASNPATGRTLQQSRSAGVSCVMSNAV